MNMEKKLYETPALEVVEMECVSILAGSIDVGIGGDIDEGTTQDTKKFDGFKHTWE